jgi:tetratricopeptide (TPR) repeat protein
MLRRNRTAAILIVAAIPLILIALYFRAAPSRRENTLRTASYNELVTALKRDPTDAQALYYFGIRNRDLGRLEPAEASLEQAAKLQPDDERIALALASTQGEVGNDAACYQTLTSFAQRHPGSTGAHWALALFYAGHGDPTRSLTEAQEVTKQTPGDARAWRLISAEGLTSGDASIKALEAAQRCVALGPNDWRNQYALANVLMYLRRFRDAIPVYQKAYALAPNQTSIQALIGQAQERLATSDTELREAVATLQRAVASNPNASTTQLALGEALGRLHQYPDSERALTTAEQLDPWRREIHIALVKLYSDEKKPGEAARETGLLEQLHAYESERDRLKQEVDGPSFDPAIAFKLADLCAGHGDVAGARTQLQRLLRLPDSAEKAAKELVALQRADARYADRPIDPVALTTDSDENSHTALLLHDASGLLAQHNYPQAIDACRAILRHSPTSATAWEMLGTASVAVGNTREGFEATKRALEINPALPEAQYTLARIYFAAGLQDEAARRLQALISKHPDKAEYFNALAECQYTDDLLFKQAEENYRKAKELDPGNADYSVHLADMEVRNHKPADAERDYRQALKTAPNSTAAQTALAHFLMAEQATPDRQSEAEHLLRSVLTADPKSRIASLYLGQLLLREGDARNAVPYLETAVTTNSRDAEGWYNLARAYAALHNQARSQYCYAAFKSVSGYGDSLSNTEEAARMHPKDAPVRLKLARLYATGGYTAKAINQYQVYLSMNPGDTKAVHELQAYTSKLKAAGALPDMDYFNALVASTVKQVRQ